MAYDGLDHFCLLKIFRNINVTKVTQSATLRETYTAYK